MQEPVFFGYPTSTPAGAAGANAFTEARTIYLDLNASADAIAAGNTFTTISSALTAASALSPTANALVKIKVNYGIYTHTSTGSPLTVPSGVFIEGPSIPAAYNTMFRGAVFVHSGLVAGDTGFLEFETVTGMSGITMYAQNLPANFTTQYNMVDCNDNGLFPSITAAFEKCTFTLAGSYNGANPLSLLAATGGTPSLGNLLVANSLLNASGSGVIGLNTVAQSVVETVRFSIVNTTRAILIDCPGDIVGLRNVSFNTGANAPTYYIEATDTTIVKMWDVRLPKEKRLATSGAVVWENYNAGGGQVNYPYQEIVFADSPYVPVEGDYALDVDTSGGNVVINLPAIADAQLESESWTLKIRKSSVDVNTVTVNGNGAETINGVASITLTSQYDTAQIQPNGTEWMRWF